jgi:iron complex outermembrane receptor protein
MIRTSLPACPARRLVAVALTLGMSTALFAQDPPPAAEEPAESADPATAESAPADETAAPADGSAPAEPAPDAAAATEPAAVPVPAEPAAQAAAEGEGTSLETIQVTGSRLKRTDYESSQPVVSISREDILRAGLTDIAQILRHLTVAGNNSATPQQGRFALSMGEVNLDLRNLGASHTLLLVNGRRWVTGLVATQPSVSDYNTIPTAIIERVEILKDGASAIYGSDAIGGVVNIITRKDYDGAAVGYHIGQFADHWDGTNQQATFTWGNATPTSSTFVNLSYTDQARASNEARELTRSPVNGIVRQSAVTTRGTIILVNPAPQNDSYGCPAAIGATQPVENPLGVGPNQVGAGVTQCTLQRNVDATPGSALATDWHQGARTDPGVSPDDVYNRFGEGSLTEPNERTALYVQQSMKLMDQLSFTIDGLYNVRKSTSVGQRGYMGGGDRLFLNSQSWLAYIPASHLSNPFGQDIGRDSGCVDQDAPDCTHLGTGTGLWAIRLGGDRDNQNFHDEVDTLRFAGSLGGDFDLFSLPFSWDGGYVWARNKIEELFPNPRFDLLANALQNGNGTPTCVAPCAPLNPLIGQEMLNPAAVNYVWYDAWQRNQNQQDITFFDINTSFPIGSFLPGPIALATGVEVRHDEFESNADPVLQQSLVFLNKLTNTAGSTSSKEAYLELGIPLIADLPLVQTLELDIAGRYSKYPTFGDVTTGKAGIRWKPIDDLLVRGTYSTGFRAPNIGELYNGQNQSFDGVVDPCVNTDPPTTDTNLNCAADGASGGGTGQVGVVQPYGLWQGNPNLKPEKSENLTYGLVYSPEWLPDLNVSLDFYDITITDFITIGGLVGQYFIDACAKSPREQPSAPDSGPHCEKVHRDGGGTLTHIDTPWFNLAAIETAGVDGGVDYLLPVPAPWGQFKLTLEASYLEKFNQITPHVGGLDDVTGLVGTDGGQFSGYPRWKAGGVLSWKGELWSASWVTRMAYHMMEPCGDAFDALAPVALMGVCSHVRTFEADDPTTPDVDETTVVDPARSENKMDTVFYHNLQIGRDLPGYNASLTFGVNNLLEQDPPISRSNIGVFWYNYDPNHYEPPGRQVYLRTEVKF